MSKLLIGACLVFASSTMAAPERAPVVGLPCEGCELIFDGMPDDLRPEARIVPADEPGEPLRVEGTVYDVDGEPAAGIVVYAYQTDAGGVYPGRSREAGHGTFRAWTRTDAAGRYAFDTIRPGGYPGRNTPQHIHMHVLEPGCCTYYIDDIFFADDPRLTPRQAEALSSGRAGSGIVQPEKDGDGVWQVRRDIHLGLAVPGHPRGRAG